jgi:membrane protein YqaA with SNARE-associated domain
MARLTGWILAFTKTIGGFGIFVIAFLDSSFLSFPVVTDATIVSMVAAHRERVLYYAAMATLGSVAGCTALYLVAKKGEQTFLKKRFKAKSIDWAMGVMKKHGVVAVLVAGVLPPPAPFKLFVLLAGIAEMPLYRFVLAIAVGRGVRYFGEGMLALMWGEAAVNYVHEHPLMVTSVVGVLIVVGGAAYLWWKRSGAGRAAEGAGTDSV